MGFWKAVAKGMLDKTEYERATAMQDAHDSASRQPGIIASILANRRADAWADQYWTDNGTIGRVERANTGQDLGHPPGCGCPWC